MNGRKRTRRGGDDKGRENTNLIRGEKFLIKLEIFAGTVPPYLPSTSLARGVARSRALVE